MKLTVQASGDADPSQVWDRYIRPIRWSEWAPQIRSVECPDEVLAAGVRGVVHGPCGVAVDFVIVDIDHEKRCWAWQVTVAGITLLLDHAVLDRGLAAGSGTRTTLDVTGPAPIVIGYVPIARVALGRLVR